MNVIKLLLMVGLFSIISSCDVSDSTKEVEQTKAQLENSKLYRELVNLYVGKTVPYSKYIDIGQPETLSGTNNSQWVAYFSKANFTIVTDKKTDLVKTVYIGKREF